MFEEKFKSYIPGSYLSFCFDLWKKYPFEYKITRRRVTKSGDYRYYESTGKHVITVNGDLNKWAFLITYLHEVAHRIVREKHGKRVKPHGVAWKNEFRKLLIPLFDMGEGLPEVLEAPLAVYCKNPKASTYSDSRLLEALRMFDDNTAKTISNLEEGDSFYFRGKEYLRLNKLRTRYICEDRTNQKKYLISGYALVDEKPA